MISPNFMDQKAKELSSLPDEFIYELYHTYPSLVGMQGYSDEAKLEFSMTKAALHAQLIMRNLVPAEI